MLSSLPPAIITMHGSPAAEGMGAPQLGVVITMGCANEGVWYL